MFQPIEDDPKIRYILPTNVWLSLKAFCAYDILIKVFENKICYVPY